MDPIVEVALACALAALWLVGAAHKIAKPNRFRATLADYRVLPKLLVAPAAAMITTFELGLGIVLLAPIERSLPFVASAALLALYAGAVCLNLLRGRRHIDCGCSSPGLRQPLSARLVARNLALAAAAIAAASFPVESRPLTWLDIVTIVATVGIVAAMHATLNRLQANARALENLE